jgi:hypothetical protein
MIQEIISFTILAVCILILAIKYWPSKKKKEESVCKSCSSDCSGCPVSELKSKSPGLSGPLSKKI